jgi:hypothetical protein
MFLSSEPHLLAKVCSGAATCPMASGSASPRGELQRCHVFFSSGPRLPTEVGSDAATWPWPRLLERRAPVLPRTPCPQRAVDHMNKERPSCPRCSWACMCPKHGRILSRRLQGVRTGHYILVQQCNVDPADHSWTWLQ